MDGAKGQPSTKLTFQPGMLNTRVSIDYEDISSVSSEVRPRKRKGNFGRNKHEKKLCTGIIFTDLFGVDT
jgi:hypothetical protein